MAYRPPEKKVEPPEQCQYCYGQGWLPIDGEWDAEVDSSDGTISLLLLIPTQWRRCFCSESDLLPEGVVV